MTSKLANIMYISDMFTELINNDQMNCLICTTNSRCVLWASLFRNIILQIYGDENSASLTTPAILPVIAPILPGVTGLLFIGAGVGTSTSNSAVVILTGIIRALDAFPTFPAGSIAATLK